MEFEIRELLEHVPAVVCRFTHVGDVWATKYITENINMYGYNRDEFLSNSMTWFDLVHPDDRIMASKTVHDYEAHNIREFRLYYRLVKKDGESVPVTEYNTINRDPNGNIESYDTVIISNTIPIASHNLLDNHYKQQIVLNDILMTLHDTDLDKALQIILDRTGEYLDTSRALLFKDSPDHKTCKVIYEWRNQGISSVKDLDYSITYETEMPEIYVALQETGSLLVNFGEIPANCAEEFEAEGLIASAIFAVYLNGDHFGFICFDDCIVERVWDSDTVRFLKNISNLVSNVIYRQYAAARLEESQKKIEQIAYSDYLTKLSNRFSCDKELQQLIDNAESVGEYGYLLFVDLDDFKIVNDCYGHDYGDAVLISISEWLKEMFQPAHKVFRFGGDEFIVLLDYKIPVNIDELLEMLHQRASQPWEAKDRSFHCSFSIGVVVYGKDGFDSKTLIKQADIAMYEAKRLGKNRHSIYDASLDTSSKNRTRVEQILREAMANDFAGVEIHYQPVVNNKTRKIAGAEALLRIRHGDILLAPAEFLQLAEYMGFTIPIGTHVLRQALLECKKINERGYTDFKIIVNLTAKQLQEKNVLDKFENIIDEIGISYDNVVISFSEKTALENFEKMELVSRRLQAMGIHVVLDDFGGGSASFIRLHELPVERIITSLSLVKNIDDQYTQQFLNLIIEFCHSMGKRVCINGIETESEFQFCSKSKADMLQGFYLYEVIEKESLAELLKGK